MKIIQVHNYYKHPGGEDTVVRAEYDLLEKHGHTVISFHKKNDDICDDSDTGIKKSLALFTTAIKTIWNHSSYRELRKLIQTTHPDIVHCHNIFPLISPLVIIEVKNIIKYARNFV